MAYSTPGDARIPATTGSRARPAGRSAWSTILITGLILWVATVVITFVTANANLVPTLVLLLMKGQHHGEPPEGTKPSLLRRLNKAFDARFEQVRHGYTLALSVLLSHRRNFAKRQVQEMHVNRHPAP